MREVDIDPTQTDLATPVDGAPSAADVVRGAHVFVPFDDDEELGPTIVRGRE